MTDGPGSVSTLMLVEEGKSELLFPEKNGLGELGIEGVPE